MSNTQFALVAWFALLTHVVIGVMTWRRTSGVQLTAYVNIAVAICVIAYAATRWYGNVFRGIFWNWTDQLMPLYAIVALLLALLSLTGRMQATWPNTLVFIVNLLVSLAAVLFVSFFKMNRLF